MSAEHIRDILRRSEPARERLGVHPVTELAHKINATVADENMNVAIALKVARAVVDGWLDVEEVIEILDALNCRRPSGKEIKNRGAYFRRRCITAFERHGRTW